MQTLLLFLQLISVHFLLLSISAPLFTAVRFVLFCFGDYFLFGDLSDRFACFSVKGISLTIKLGFCGKTLLLFVVLLPR